MRGIVYLRGPNRQPDLSWMRWNLHRSPRPTNVCQLSNVVFRFRRLFSGAMHKTYANRVGIAHKAVLNPAAHILSDLGLLMSRQ